jgi:hypothetical protein
MSERLGVNFHNVLAPARIEQLDGSSCIVGHCENLIEVDLQLHPIALDNFVEPRARIKGLRILKPLPLVDPTGPAALAPDEVLAN